MIIIESSGNDIHLFGREKNLKRYHKIIKFKPYYYSIGKGKHKTIMGEPCEKITYNNQNKKLPKKYAEADVKHTHRYLADMKEEINKEPIRIQYVDIETEMFYGIDVDNTPNKILSIAVYDTFFKKYIVFIIAEKQLKEKPNTKIYKYNNETLMLKAFIRFIADTNPDMLVGWNIQGFDAPYIVNRMRKIGLNPNDLSRMKITYVSHKKTKIKGRVVFDLMDAYKRITIYQGKKESYSLEFISRLELGIGKEKHNGLENLYSDDINKFITYNVRDVELLIKLENKLNIIEFFDEFRRFAHCTFNDVFYSSKIIDQIILREAKKKSIVLPSQQENNKIIEKFEGGYVKKPPIGLFDNVAVFDVNSMYPNIILSCNIGYETWLQKKQEGCINIDDKFFYSKQNGFMNNILNQLLKDRFAIKVKMKQLPTDSDEYKTLNLKQQGMKIILNSYYGVLSFKKFRLYRREAGETITYIGREMNHFIERFIKSKGLTMIAGDTDSLFMERQHMTIKNCEQFEKEINKHFDLFAKRFNITEHSFKIAFEKSFKTILFTGAKKRYAGILEYKDGKQINEMSITGFETRRSDTPRIGKTFMKELFCLILAKEEKSKVYDLIDGYKKKILNAPLIEIGFPSSVTKDLSQYKNVPIHIRAIMNSNKYLKTDFKQGDKIKYIYVKNWRDNVVAFKETLPKNIQVDYDKIIDRIIDKKAQGILTAVGMEKNKQMVL